MTGEIHELPGASAPSPGGSGGGDNRDIHGRVSALEARLDYLATKEDVQSIKTWALSGALGGMVLAATLAITILKLFE